MSWPTISQRIAATCCVAAGAEKFLLAAAHMSADVVRPERDEPQTARLTPGEKLRAAASRPKLCRRLIRPQIVFFLILVSKLYQGKDIRSR
jgi:hypothetical protein